MAGYHVHLPQVGQVRIYLIPSNLRDDSDNEDEDGGRC